MNPWSGFVEDGRWLITFSSGDTLGIKRVGDALIATSRLGSIKEGMRFHRQ